MNHARVGPVQDVRRALAIVGGALSDLLALIFAVVVLSVFFPTVDCGPRSKIWLSKMLSVTDNARSTITSRIKQQHSLKGVGTGLDTELSPAKQNGVISFGLVTSEGTIVVATNDPRAALVFQPSFAGDTVTWSCFGGFTGFPLRYC